MSQFKQIVLELIKSYNNATSDDEKESWVEEFSSDLAYIEELILIINELRESK